MSLLERDQAAAYFAEEVLKFYYVLKLVQKAVTSKWSDFIWFACKPWCFRTTRLDRIGQENRIQIHVPYLLLKSVCSVGTTKRWIFSVSDSSNASRKLYCWIKRLSDQGQTFEDLLEEVNVQR